MNFTYKATERPPPRKAHGSSKMEKLGAGDHLWPSPLFPGESDPEKNLKEQQTQSSGENNSDLLGLQL